MSRFSGWTAAAVEKLTSDLPAAAETKQKSVAKHDTPDYVGQISGALYILGVEHVREYKFLADRRFKFDLAIPEKKIAIEFEGGIWTGGRHTRGKGYANDVKKYNLATMHGWRLLRFTTEDAKGYNWEFQIANGIKELVNHPKDF